MSGSHSRQISEDDIIDPMFKRSCQKPKDINAAFNLYKERDKDHIFTPLAV